MKVTHLFNWFTGISTQYFELPRFFQWRFPNYPKFVPTEAIIENFEALLIGTLAAKERSRLTFESRLICVTYFQVIKQ